MSAEALFTLFGGCFVGGLVPWMPAELLVATAVLLVSPGEALGAAAVAAAGQMAGKAALYAAARWTPERLPSRARMLLLRARRRSAGGAATGAALVLSAGVGLPPFYLSTIVAGAVRTSAVVFVACGFLGTFLRYAVVARGALFVVGPQ